LDLRQDRAGVDVADLWTAWVVRPTEADLLTARAAAQARYEPLVPRAGEWGRRRGGGGAPRARPGGAGAEDDAARLRGAGRLRGRVRRGRRGGRRHRRLPRSIGGPLE